ncbi:hypothetical protein BHM03_00051686 [Ensete ventricosum]|nr:hypothetical protein BHM03_00051686 [Ensete ventricosum]
MANRVKEDEKNEKIIRGLLKLPTNRRCINCNNLVRFFSSVNRGSKKKRQGRNMYAQISGLSSVQIVVEYSKYHSLSACCCSLFLMLPFHDNFLFPVESSPTVLSPYLWLNLLLKKLQHFKKGEMSVPEKFTLRTGTHNVIHFLIAGCC